MMRGERRRASRGNTHDPFDCCGKEAPSYGRPKGTICRDCRALIDEGTAARKNIPQDRRPFIWTKVSHGWPQFYGSGTGIPSDARDALAGAFYALTNLIVQPAPADTPWFRPGDNEWPTLLTGRSEHDLRSWLTGWRCLVLGRPDTVAALDALHRAIMAALGATYRAGKERGGSALFGLASGELSLSDFDETLNPGKERSR